MKKLSPQQLRVNAEKLLAKGSKIEKLLMDEEIWRQDITKMEKEWEEQDKIYRKALVGLRQNLAKANRLVRYKRAQIIGKEK
ncbi:hypothetical protein LCGC14_0372460 [marine sediment metagenome]|uniref:Uncharacterized protein n=1 Tax=marine sediment metagenome TaxID=412755 RepID=A0A0F9T4V0_9ZZZZ